MASCESGETVLNRMETVAQGKPPLEPSQQHTPYSIRRVATQPNQPATTPFRLKAFQLEEVIGGVGKSKVFAGT
jgi:hypothetical protein